MANNDFPFFKISKKILVMNSNEMHGKLGVLWFPSAICELLINQLIDWDKYVVNIIISSCWVLMVGEGGYQSSSDCDPTPTTPIQPIEQQPAAAAATTAK